MGLRRNTMLSHLRPREDGDSRNRELRPDGHLHDFLSTRQLPMATRLTDFYSVSAKQRVPQVQENLSSSVTRNEVNRH